MNENLEYDRPASRSDIPKGEQVELPDNFKISALTHFAANGWPLKVELRSLDKTVRCHLICDDNRCGQSIYVLSIENIDGSDSYLIRLKDIHSSVLRHMMQRHNWTREGPGNGR